MHRRPLRTPHGQHIYLPLRRHREVLQVNPLPYLLRRYVVRYRLREVGAFAGPWCVIVPAHGDKSGDSPAKPDFVKETYTNQNCHVNSVFGSGDLVRKDHGGALSVG